MRVFVINLARSIERRQAIEKNFDDFGLVNFEFFEAVDGQRLTERQKSLVDAKEIRRRMGRDMSRGEIGCALSHILLCQKIVDEGIEHAIILEDDAVIGPGFSGIVNSGELEDSPYSLVLLHGRTPLVLKWPTRDAGEGRRFYRYCSQASGATAYYVRRVAAFRLVRESLPIAYVADWPRPIHQWLGTACLHPFQVYPPRDAHSVSTLQEERTKVLKEVERTGPGHSTRRGLWQKMLSLLVLPCILSPEVFGTVSDLREHLLNHFLKLLSTHNQRKLTWAMPEGWPEQES